jgi:dolichol-phosphate mannosyltransferase
MLTLTILIATLNEERNLEDLIPELHQVFAKEGVGYEILIIDGGSADGTVATATRLGARVERQELPSYAEAIRQGIRQARGTYLIVMDADQSHSPQDALRLFQHRGGADIIINSRYMPGGGSESPLGRRLLSRFLNFLYRTALDLPFREISGGFRIYPTEILKRFQSQSLHYEIQEELLLIPYWSGHTAKEIPYIYRNRKQGSSKVKLFTYGVHLLRAIQRFRAVKKGLIEKRRSPEKVGRLAP